MASAQMLALLVALVVAPLAFANDLPTGGCKSCSSGGVLAYAQVPFASKPSGMNSYNRFGLAVSGGVTTAYSGNTNYEYIYTTSAQSGSVGKSIVDNLLPASAMPANIDGIGSYQDCCAACANTPGCLFYVYYPASSVTLTGQYPTAGGKPVTATGAPYDTVSTLSFPTDGVPSLPSGISHRCNLLKKMNGYYLPSMYSFQPTGSNGAAQAANPKAILGGTCNPTIADDPHLVGAHGTKFDFNGALHQPYCLVTDTDVHVNILLDGYIASNGTEKATRTWIKELGIMWRHEGEEHSAHLVARGGKQQERGNGFLQRLTVDGAALPVPSKAGGSITAAGSSFRLDFVGGERHHIFDVDHFSVTAGGVLGMDVRMRVAHPNLQTPGDAQAHFNLGFETLQASPSVHGVLGQTYRTTAEQSQRAARFQELARSLNGPLVADGANGKGFLDGEARDYISSAVLAPDCKFSAFRSAASISQGAVMAS